MRQFCEALQSRILLSSVASVTADYDAVVADAGAIKVDFVAAATTYKANAKIIALDIKELGKSKTNAADITALNKTVAAATATDTKDGSALIAAGKTAIAHAKTAFLADVHKPTAANGVKLSSALAALSIALSPFETKLAGAVTAGDASVDAALGVLVTANSSDTALSTAVSTAESDTVSALATITGGVASIDEAIITLVDAV